MHGIVTAVEPQQRRGGRRVNIFVDGRYAFSLEKDLSDLVRVGQPVDELKTAELLLADERARAFEAALTFLSCRQRSERELRDRLQRQSVPEDVVEATVERLRGLGLLDDAEFARYWIDQRQTHRPRGTRRLRMELQQKGIDQETLQAALGAAERQEDPSDAAYRAARRKLRTLERLPDDIFKQKLGQFLLRQGFDYEVARSVTRRLLAERETDRTP